MTGGIELVYLLLALAGAGGGAYWKWGGQIGKVRDDLAAHKLHVAETYVTKAGMSEQTAQIMKAIDGVGMKIDRTNERLDGLMQSRAPARRST